MTVPNDISLKSQNTLRDLVRDDWTFSGMCFWRRDFLTYQNDPNDACLVLDWQLSVDFIYRCLISGLIEIINYERYADNAALVDDLRRCNPFDMQKGGLAWNGVFTYGTEQLEAIVKRFFKNDDEYASTVNREFIAAIGKAFEDAGVPWSNKPLIPVLSHISPL